MKNVSSIQVKSALLLLVFTLNTIVGFACAVGVKMNFNLSHHSIEATNIPIHIHADGIKHEHSPAPKKVAAHTHANGKKHEHSNESQAKHDEKETPVKEEGGCCSDDVVQFQQMDKSLIQAVKKVEDVPVFNTIDYGFVILVSGKSFSGIKFQKARYLFPPPDILISIQRFQI